MHDCSLLGDCVDETLVHSYIFSTNKGRIEQYFWGSELLRADLNDFAVWELERHLRFYLGGIISLKTVNVEGDIATITTTTTVEGEEEMRLQWLNTLAW